MLKELDLDRLEKEVLDDFFKGNIRENQIPELTEQIARIAARISVITAAKIAQHEQMVSE